MGQCHFEKHSLNYSVDLAWDRTRLFRKLEQCLKELRLLFDFLKNISGYHDLKNNLETKVAPENPVKNRSSLLWVV